MSVIPYPQPAPPPARLTWIDVMDRGSELAEMIANTDFVPKGLRGNQAAIVAAILYGHEVGLEPMQSLGQIAVIDGKPSMSSEAMRALILQEGHELYPEEVNNTRATMAARRKGSKQTVRVTWTLDDAKRAKIAGKANWQMYPRQMLVARATAELARQVFADVIHGMAATEELEDVAEGDTPTVEAEPKTTRRRRRPTPPPAAPRDPDPEVPATAQETAAGTTAPPSSSETPAEPDPPSQRAMNKLFALFNEKGFGDDRDKRLAYSQRILDRKISSSTELTAADLHVLVTALEAEPDPDPPATTEAEVMGALEAELDAREVPSFEPPEDVKTLLDERQDDAPNEPEQPPLPDELPEGF